MGWIKTLADTYDACQDLVGVADPASIILDKDGKKVRELRPLTPLYHCVKKCEYILTVDAAGNFVSARVIDRNEFQYCIIPCTADNESRTNSPEKMPFPLHENIGIITIENPFEEFENVYMAQMYDWIHSSEFAAAGPEAAECILPVYEYLKKGTLLRDMMVNVPEFAEKMAAKADDALKATLKFAVTGMKNDGPEDLTLNKYAWKAWVCYAEAPDREDKYQRRVGQMEAAKKGVPYKEPKKKVETVHYGVCFATGEENVKLCTKGPKSIIRQGENAKLLPVQYGSTKAPATGKYTFMSDYFKSSEHAMTVGEEAVQKATIMLRWLCDHQSWTPVSTSSQTLIVWDKFHPESVSPQALMVSDVVKPMAAHTQEESYQPNDMVQKMIWRECNGYEVDGISELSKDIIVMILENTSTGRCSITYYNETSADEFLQSSINWHNSAGWGGADYESKDMALRAPSVRDMLLATLGDGYWKSAAKSALVTRIFQNFVKCINNEQTPIPLHCVNLAFQNQQRTMSFMANAGGNYEQARRAHRRALNATCGMLRRNMNLIGGEHMSATIDFECMDRDYLYGRALAYFDNIEAWAQNADARKRGGKGSSRATNAWNLYSSYFSQPETTCLRLMKSINPYVSKLWDSPSLHRKMDELNAIIANIGGRDGNKPLGPKGMLGFSAQQEYFHLERISMTHKADGDADVDAEGNFEI